MPAGRPSEYTEEMGDEICDAIAISTVGLDILRSENPHWPQVGTIYSWRVKIPEFAEKYARAKIAQADVLVEQNMTIAHAGYDTHIGIMNAKMRIDENRWQAGKLKPKKWGDKVEPPVSSSDEVLDEILRIVHDTRSNS